MSAHQFSFFPCLPYSRQGEQWIQLWCKWDSFIFHFLHPIQDYPPLGASFLVNEDKGINYDMVKHSPKFAIWVCIQCKAKVKAEVKAMVKSTSSDGRSGLKVGQLKTDNPVTKVLRTSNNHNHPVMPTKKCNKRCWWRCSLTFCFFGPIPSMSLPVYMGQPWKPLNNHLCEAPILQVVSSKSVRIDPSPNGGRFLQNHLVLWTVRRIRFLAPLMEMLQNSP